MEEQQQLNVLSESLMHWLPEPKKIELLVCMYAGTIRTWCNQDDADLLSMMKNNLAWLWVGLRSEEPYASLQVEPVPKEEKQNESSHYWRRLAGLTAAAYLSENPHVEGILFERSPQLGGRAFTYEKAGFTLNYGAHAIYGIDRHTLTTMERELGTILLLQASG